MAMPAIEHRLWTVEEVQAIPDDGNRYECIDGELFVSPSPTRAHQQAVLELIDINQPCGVRNFALKIRTACYHRQHKRKPKQKSHPVSFVEISQRDR